MLNQVTVAILLDKFVNASLQVCEPSLSNTLQIMWWFPTTFHISMQLVLLITTFVQTEMEERAKNREAKDSHNLLCSTMDPLLARLAKVCLSLLDTFCSFLWSIWTIWQLVKKVNPSLIVNMWDIFKGRYRISAKTMLNALAQEPLAFGNLKRTLFSFFQVVIGCGYTAVKIRLQKFVSSVYPQPLVRVVTMV